MFRLMGVSAGKSTFINAVVGAPLLPSNNVRDFYSSLLSLKHRVASACTSPDALPTPNIKDVHVEVTECTSMAICVAQVEA